MKLLWMFHVLVLSGNGHPVLCNDISFKNVNTWETVILPCQAGTSVIIKRWHRGNDKLFQGVHVNANATGNNRYAIVGNQNIGEYNLQISNTTEEDNGTYVCYIQLTNNITSITYVLIVKERNTLKPITFMSTNPNDEELSTLSEKRMSTENNEEDSGKESRTETGILSREMLYYGLLAAGLVLVLFLSIMCNACVNRKYKGTLPKATENIAKNDISDEITERNDDSSLYERINENDMLPNSPIELKWGIRKEASAQNKSIPITLPERPYSEIDDSYLDAVPVNNIDQSKKLLHINLELSKARHHLKRRISFTEGTSPSQESDNVTVSEDDGYLHPYCAIKTDDMESLHSYCTPYLVPVEISTVFFNTTGPEAANDHYTDGFSANEVITQV